MPDDKIMTWEGPQRVLDELREKARKWDEVMKVYHAEQEERFVQFANTMSKVRELAKEPR